ncbi:MAG: GGDEF domain-containing protein [Lachnospirales bacterium]
MEFESEKSFKVKILALFFVGVLSSVVLVTVVFYTITFNSMIDNFRERAEKAAESIYPKLGVKSFTDINIISDMNTSKYEYDHVMLSFYKDVCSLEYVYTGKINQDGKAIYLTDGLDYKNVNFLTPGSIIEESTDDNVYIAMNEKRSSAKLIIADWGTVYATVWPIYPKAEKINIYKDQNVTIHKEYSVPNSEPVGFLSIEIDAHFFYENLTRGIVPMTVIILVMILAMFVFLYYLLNRVTNPYFKTLALTDYLTGLANRTAFEMTIKNFTENTNDDKNNSQKALVVCDLNFLKITNDTFGHEKGDELLKDFAIYLRLLFGKKSNIFRIGGDEFVVVVNNNKSILEETLEINKYQDEIRFKKISFSYGIADFSESDKFLTDTFARADRLMYEMKIRMKNKITENEYLDMCREYS